MLAIHLRKQSKKRTLFVRKKAPYLRGFF